MAILYPIIVFKDEKFIDCAMTQDEFETCTNTAYESQYYQGLIVIDSEGLEYRVASAKKIGTKGFFRGFNIFLNQSIKVCIEYESLTGQKADINRFKEMLSQSTGQNYFLEHTVLEIREMPSFEKIVPLICSEFYRKY